MAVTGLIYKPISLFNHFTWQERNDRIATSTFLPGHLVQSCDVQCSPCFPAAGPSPGLSSSLSSEGAELLCPACLGLHLLTSLQVVNGGTRRKRDRQGCNYFFPNKTFSLLNEGLNSTVNRIILNQFYIQLILHECFRCLIKAYSIVFYGF